MATSDVTGQWRALNSRWLRQAQYDVARLQQLGVDIEYLAEHYNNSLTPDDINELLNGVLYLKQRYPQIWNKNSNIIATEDNRKLGIE